MKVESFPRAGQKAGRRITLIVVHCAATPPHQDVGAAEIGAWHRKRGFRSIGYHYVIRRNGAIETGRALSRAGAHVQGHNAHSIGICMAGGVSAEDFTRAENNFTPA